MNDFRETLKAHSEVFNQKAWEQMSELLDQTQERKPKLFLWYFFGILMGIGCVLFLDIFNVVDSNSKLSISPNIVDNESLKNQQATTYKINRQDGKLKGNSHQNGEGKLMQKSIVKVQNYQSNLYNNNSCSILNIGKSVVKNNIGINTRTKINHNAPNNLLTDYDLLPKTATTMQNDEMRSGQNKGSLYSTVTSSNDTLNKTEKPHQEDKHTIPQSIDVQSISSIHTNYLQTYHSINAKNIIIERRNHHSLFFTIHGGYIFFNENPGYQTGLGILKDQNRLFGYGLECVYSRATATSDDGLSGYEIQFDINGFVQLNFLRTFRHKLNIDLSMGYTTYSGKRLLYTIVPSLEVRSSTGYNYNFGLSYSYYLRKDQFFGVKFNFISYDDAITAICLKYGKSF